MAGTNGPMHQLKDDIRLTDGNAMQVATELSRRVLLELGDTFVFDFDLQVHVGIESHRFPIVIHKPDIHVGGLCTNINLQFASPRTGISVV